MRNRAADFPILTGTRKHLLYHPRGRFGVPFGCEDALVFLGVLIVRLLVFWIGPPVPPSARPSRVVVVLPPLIGNLENDAPACSSIASASPTLQDQPRFACVAGLERIRAELCNQQRPPACQWPDGVADV